jgi:hypothetical protein
MDFSVYYRNLVINHMLRAVSHTPVPNGVYVALFKADTGLSSNNPTSEVTGVGYSRKQVTLSAATVGDSANSADITFDPAEEDWGIITHIALVDHATNTSWGTNVNVLMWDNLRDSSANPATKDVKDTDVLKIVQNKLTIEVR